MGSGGKGRTIEPGKTLSVMIVSTAEIASRRTRMDALSSQQYDMFITFDVSNVNNTRLVSWKSSALR